MLLTDELVDRIHSARVGRWRERLEATREVLTECDAMAAGAGYAFFAGDGSPLTQVYGMGHRDTPWNLDAVESFYRGRATSYELIVTPFTCQGMMKDAARRGFVPDHFETVLALEVGAVEPPITDGFAIQEVTGDLELWMRTSDSAWGELDLLPEEPSPIARLMSCGRRTRRFLATVGGEPAATAALTLQDGVGHLAGAATRRQFRGRGIQSALVRHRLACAGPGSLVLFVALPGSQSHRNAQRFGFQPLYSKLVMVGSGQE